MNKKKLNYENKKCKSCGSNLIFSPKHNALHCKNCGNLYNIETDSNFEIHHFETVISNVDNHHEWAEQNKMLKCKDCGAEIILDKYEYSSTCSYCGSSVVSKLEELPGLKPDAIIPFKFDGHDAMLRFNENIKKKWFIPNGFKKKVPTSDITGTYIACFSFNANTTSAYSGVFAYDESYEDFDGNTKTRTRYVTVSGLHTADFKNILVESNQHITDSELNNIRPFNFEETKAFNQDFLKGYIVEHYNEDANTCFDIAKAKMINQIKQSLLQKHKCTRIEQINLDIEYKNKSYSYYLLPVYLFIYKYKEKTYKTIMNGQNGKLGSNVPRSATKITLLTLFIVLLFMLMFILPFIL